MPTFFPTPAEFRNWLQQHAARAAELEVGYWKLGSGQPSMTWPESVDEALCFGWIDGVRHRIDAHSYRIRFSPRRPGSTWSAVNIARVAVLEAEGRMTEAGRAAFARRSAEKSAVYAYEQPLDQRPAAAALDTDAVATFRADPPAWDWFQAQPPGWRRKLEGWVMAAKQAETKAARLARLIEAAREGRRL